MTALCEKCLAEIPSKTVERSTGIWLEKECPIHDYSEHLIEPDVEFWRMAHVKAQGPEAEFWKEYYSSTSLDVTRRCNVQCPACYAEPDNSTSDPAFDDVVAEAKLVRESSRSINLMGAEPTMRNDLPELVTAIKAATGKLVGIYTNGIRLADERYVKRLSEARLDYACVSVHSPEYLSDPRTFDMKVRALGLLSKAGIPINHVSYSLRNLDELGIALSDGQRLVGLAGHVRIRSPQRVGTCLDKPFFLSELYYAAVDMLQQAGLNPELLPSDNNGYHVQIRAGGMVYRLIRFPSLETADLDELNTGPYAFFDKESGEINLVHSLLLQAAKRHRKPVALIKAKL